MSIQADVESDIEVTLGSIPYVKDYEIKWNEEVNIMPDYIDIRVWVDHEI